jgi:hypothetical protein
MAPAPVVTAELLELVTSLVAQRTAAPAGPEHAMEVLEALVRRAAEMVAGAEWASVTVVRHSGSPLTLTYSHDEALQADQIQYRLKEGPCLEAAEKDNVYLTGEIHCDPRWSRYGTQVHRQVGVTSVLAYRLTLLGNESADAALNLYARTAHSFDRSSVRQALVFATQCSLLISAYLANDRAEHLVRALGSNREIGMAMGIIMAKHLVTSEEAFMVLRLASQHTNRKLAEVAAQVVATGAVPEPPRQA